MNKIQAYKLIRVRKNGTLGPLFINKTQIIPIGKWLMAEFHPTKGYSPRKGWHVTSNPIAPHLSEKGRKWFKVEIQDYEKLVRPESQGGIWYIANKMKVIEQIGE